MPPPQSDRSLLEWVAVIDDHPSMRLSLTRALNAYGITVESFGCAEDYLQLGAEAQPCCLVLDVQLPGMSGFDLRKALVARDESPPPIVLISAAEGDLPSDVARSDGLCRYLRKPFAIGELIELLRPHLSRALER